MTAEAEVCNGAVPEVAGIEEKPEFKGRSFQDLAKPELDGIGNHDEPDDPEDSYVLVNRVGDPSGDGKDMAAVDGSPRHESGAPGAILGTELDARNGNPESTNVGKHENVEAGDAAVYDSPRHESSPPVELLGIEGANVGKDILAIDSPDVQVISVVDGGGNLDSTVEEENKYSKELNDQGGKIDAVNGEVDPTSREGEIGNAGSTDKNPSMEDEVLVGVEGSVQDWDEIQDKLAVNKPECEVETEINKAEDSNGKIERSEEAEVADKLTVSKPEYETESEIKKAEDSNGKIERSEEAKVANKLAVSELECKAKSESTKADDTDGKIERPEEYEVVNKLAVSEPECEVESEIKKAAYSNGKIERSEESEVANKLAVTKPECEAEFDIKKAEDSNGKIEIYEESEVANKLAVSEPKCEAESEIKKAEDSNGKIERSEEAEVANKQAVTEPECETESDIKKAEDSNGKIEISEEAEVANNLDVSKPGYEAESENKKAKDSNGKIERSEEAEFGKIEDQNGKIGVMAVPEPDSVEEKQESKVPNLGLVADSEEKDETKNLLSPSDEQDLVEDGAESVLGEEAIQDQKRDTDPEKDIQYGLDKDKVLEGAADCIVGTACSKVLEGKDEGIFSVSHVQGSIMYPDSAVNYRDDNGAAHEISVSEIDVEASGPTHKKSASSAQFHRHAIEVKISDAETAEVISSLPVDGSESESFGTEPIRVDSLESNTISGGSDSVIRMDVSNETEPISQNSELSANSEDDRNPPVSSLKLEPEVVDHVAVTSEKDATSGSDVLDSFVSDKGVSNSMPESAAIIAMVDGATRSDDKTLLLAKNGDTGNSCSLDISKALPESSHKVTKEDVSGVDVTKPFNYFVRLPRYSDEKLQEQIRIAELEVNDKTILRDSIQAQIQELRTKNQNIGIDYEYAKSEDRSLKKLLKEKRMEIDALQSVINKAKNATSIEDLNSRIKAIEYIIQHETLPLKEEKQLIHDIKQLKQLREQLSSSKCSQNEIQQALEQREQAEERLKILRKELGILKGTASKAQTACDQAESKFSVEYKKVKELQAHFRAADDVRQEAYAKFLSLSKELSQKRKNFFKFKNDSAAATYYAFTDDRKTLYRHCLNEVEDFIELWNGNEEFRSEYVRLNTRSTVRRFGTLDGRSLGPDEKPTILPSYVSERNDKVGLVPANTDSISKTPIMELKPETKIENVSSEIHSSKKETESNAKTVTTAGPAKSKQVISLVKFPGRDDGKVEVQEEPVKTREELELMRKAEEIRREEAEAKLKEQRRLEEIMKAKEARERKQRRDEKAQKREELKARKEAEQKEKEREKKSRKNERRKAVSTSASAPMDVQDDASSVTCVEISKEEVSPQVNDVSTKKTNTSRVMVSKQNKKRSAPPPSLRSRNRRKWQQWMWVILISIAVLVLFWLGNLGVFSNVNSKLQGSGG